MYELLACVSMTDTLRSTLCSLVLLTWHLFVTFFIGGDCPDINLCSRLLDTLCCRYPQGAIILFFKGRLEFVTGNIKNALHLYRQSIDAQCLYPQIHHICYWELLFAHAFHHGWSEAIGYAEKLSKESRWSPCVYAYLLAILMNAEGATKNSDAIKELLEKVPHLTMRIAGKSLPVEKFCVKKSEHFHNTGSILFAHYEFIYFWSGFSLMSTNLQSVELALDDIDATYRTVDHSKIDADDKCLYYFLKGVCFRYLQKYREAEIHFKKVLEHESEIIDYKYLPPNATFEMALLQIRQSHIKEAEELLTKARSYKGYLLETRLHFRFHSATESLGAQTPVSPLL